MRWDDRAAGEESVKIESEWHEHSLLVNSFEKQISGRQEHSHDAPFWRLERPAKNGLHALQNELASPASRRPVRSNPRSKSSSVDKRSEEHTSELQSRLHLVCRLLLAK